MLHATYVKWQTRLKSDTTYNDFIKAFQAISKITNHNKLRSFQFRLLHDAVVTNENLYYWKILSSPECQHCKDQKETIMHMLYYCPKIQKIWEDIQEYCKKLNGDIFQLSAENIILNNVHPKKSHVNNFIVLAAKTKLYTIRCLKTNLETKKIIEYIEECRRCELYNAKQTGKVGYYNKKWAKSNGNTSQNIETQVIEYLEELIYD